MSIKKRVFKTKTFSRWANKVLCDSTLCQAAREIEQGLFEADLGGGLCKKRVALPGRGKSGSLRTLVAKKHKDAIFFLVGREKSKPGSDFSDQEVDAAKIIGAGLQAADATKLDELVAADVLKEICNVT
ncbi:type II toxin-antitoxin system RelE/ParE family toxin [Rhodoferax sp. AJA081-3]|uniref:type II toxin-antitoxin system RelE/ParE family toxin n=1 Tax=Rhodoferax sp. AJA081-3 TaxID=2752316 RepID=UPI001AE053A7|nr:type II toxin-antitoxin system RelE/ParE family toxin [Rhodoferax sp. AJA081-3]QTN29861.1 type II toxin-antitoxin system RelE/ParE family toxin [Rhodoferax sp. AJA081-3]